MPTTTPRKSALLALSILLPILFLTAPGAFASESEDSVPAIEVSALSNGSFFFNSDGHFGYAVAGVSVPFLVPGLQLSFNLAYLNVGNSTYNYWAIGGLVGPVINFPLSKDVRDAAFASAKYGAGAVGGTNINSSTSDTSRGLLDFSVGKRFSLGSRFSYAPEIGLSKVIGGSGSNSPVFRVVLLGFSAFF